MKQSTRPAVKRSVKITRFTGLTLCSAVLLAGILLAGIFYPVRNTSCAADDDDTAWQGTVKVVTSYHNEVEKDGYTSLGGKGHSVYRDHREETATYTSFRLLPENEEMRSWKGAANVSLAINGSSYHLETTNENGEHEEQGYDRTITGATAAQGEVRFFRYPSPDDPRKAKCCIEVDALDNGWRDRPELIVWEQDRSWRKSRDLNFDKTEKNKHYLAPKFVHVEFDCDSKAASYSGNDDHDTDPAQHDRQVVTWNISHREADTEAVIVSPNHYGKWMPMGGADEDTPGNAIAIRARVHKKGDPKKSSPQAAQFKFQLVEVGKEKGVCLNWPPDFRVKEDKTFDLKIDAKLNPELKVAPDGQSAESKKSLKESSVIINSYDWGAYGKLKVTVDYDDGHEEVAHVEGDPSKQEWVIPKDDNSNHISDFWEKHYPAAGTDATLDDDLFPIGDQACRGDGLSFFEEYRGFSAQGKHIRTSPIEKDLFIYDQDHLGLGYFAQSGLATHLIKWDEFGGERGATNPNVINKNRGFATWGPQHALYLTKASLKGNIVGIATGAGPPGPPKTTGVILVDAVKCRAINEQTLQSTIAHELAHGCSVRHHGEKDYYIFTFEFLINGQWRKAIVDNPAPFRVAVQGGQESGVKTCIMRYCSAAFYETPDGPNKWIKSDGSEQRGADYPPNEPEGTIFCNDKKGTGVAGNATEGNCKSQFCVNDN